MSRSDNNLCYCCRVAMVLIAVVAFVVGIAVGRLMAGRRAAEAAVPVVQREVARVSAPESVKSKAVEAAAPETAGPPVQIDAAPAVRTDVSTASAAPRRKLRETTVLVCDVGSGSAEEELPANVLRCLSDLQRILAGIIGDEGGSVDRFAGDRVIAVFSAKGRRTDHAGHALEAARRIANNVDAVSRRLHYDFRIGIGVHSGALPIGDDGHVDAAAIGDAIDVASRLEALATEAKVSVVVSEEVLERAEEAAGAFEAAGEIALTDGAPQRVFTLKSRDGAQQLDLIDLRAANASIDHPPVS